MKQKIFLALLMISFQAAATDMEECNDQMHRVYRAARDANNTISSSDELERAGSVLDEIQSRIDKARSACQANTARSYCSQLRQLVVQGQRNEAKQICATHFERMYPGFCGTCLGK